MLLVALMLNLVAYLYFERFFREQELYFEKDSFFIVAVANIWWNSHDAWIMKKQVLFAKHSQDETPKHARDSLSV